MNAGWKIPASGIPTEIMWVFTLLLIWCLIPNIKDGWAHMCDFATCAKALYDGLYRVVAKNYKDVKAFPSLRDITTQKFVEWCKESLPGG